MNVCELMSERVYQLYFLIFSFVSYVSFIFLFFFIFGIFAESGYITRNKSSHIKGVEQRLDVLSTLVYLPHTRLRVLSPLHSFTFFLFNLYPFLSIVFSFFFLFFTHLLSIYVQIAGTYVYKQALRHRRRTPTVSR